MQIYISNIDFHPLDFGWNIVHRRRIVKHEQAAEIMQHR